MFLGDAPSVLLEETGRRTWGDAAELSLARPSSVAKLPSAIRTSGNLSKGTKRIATGHIGRRTLTTRLLGARWARMHSMMTDLGVNDSGPTAVSMHDPVPYVATWTIKSLGSTGIHLFVDRSNITANNTTTARSVRKTLSKRRSCRVFLSVPRSSRGLTLLASLKASMRWSKLTGSGHDKPSGT